MKGNHPMRFDTPSLQDAAQNISRQSKDLHDHTFHEWQLVTQAAVAVPITPYASSLNQFLTDYIANLVGILALRDPIGTQLAQVSTDIQTADQNGQQHFGHAQ